MVERKVIQLNFKKIQMPENYCQILCFFLYAFKSRAALSIKKILFDRPKKHGRNSRKSFAQFTFIIYKNLSQHLQLELLTQRWNQIIPINLDLWIDFCTPFNRKELQLLQIFLQNQQTT